MATLDPEEYNRHSFTARGLSRNRDPANLDFNPALHVGTVAPNFAVVDLDGRPVRLSDFRSKKHVVFEFGCIGTFLNPSEYRAFYWHIPEMR